MDLIIKNASLEELTTICYRIGEPNFQEMVEAQRKFGVVEYLVNHGENLDSAIDTYDKDLQDTQVQVALENNVADFDDVSESIVETVSDELEELDQSVEEDKQEELHLEKPPEKPEINLKDNLHQLATDLVDSGRSKELIKILESFGAKSVPELNQSHYEAAIEKIKGVLNGNS